MTKINQLLIDLKHVIVILKKKSNCMKLVAAVGSLSCKFTEEDTTSQNRNSRLPEEKSPDPQSTLLPKLSFQKKNDSVKSLQEEKDVQPRYQLPKATKVVCQ